MSDNVGVRSLKRVKQIGKVEWKYIKTCKITMFPDCRQELYLDLVTIMGYWLEDEGQISIHVHYFKEITP